MPRRTGSRDVQLANTEMLAHTMSSIILNHEAKLAHCLQCNDAATVYTFQERYHAYVAKSYSGLDLKSGKMFKFSDGKAETSTVQVHHGITLPLTFHVFTAQART